MFRGMLYRGGLFRGYSMLGNGVLNVEDWKNYRSPFLLIADTGDDFMLNGILIDGGVGVVIKDPDYYEAAILDPAGELCLSHFCFWRNTVSMIEVVSEAMPVSNLQYRQQTNNRPSNMMFYHPTPIVGLLYNDSGLPTVNGVIANRSFYRHVESDIKIKILPKRTIQVFDDPVIWQAGYAKVVGNLVRPSVSNNHYYRCTVAGTTGVAEPAWPTTEGDTIADGTATWQCVVGTRELHYEQRVTS